MQILALVGSLRRGGHHRTLLEAAKLLVPPGVDLEIHPDLELPLFAPDREPNPAVLKLRSRLDASHAVLIASPEYAHGVSGVIKNALDWVVTSNQLSGKPVAAWNISPLSHHAWHALMETMRTMDAQLVEVACIRATLDAPFAHPDLKAEALAGHHHTAPMLRQALEHLVDAAHQKSQP